MVMIAHCALGSINTLLITARTEDVDKVLCKTYCDLIAINEQAIYRKYLASDLTVFCHSTHTGSPVPSTFVCNTVNLGVVWG